MKPTMLILIVLLMLANILTAQECELIPSNLAGNDHFGQSVALDSTGTYIVVGSPNSDATDQLQSTGSVYVYRMVDSCYQLQQEILTDDPSFTANVGNAVDLDAAGTYLVAGASGEDRGEFSGDYGAAYIFVHNGEAWIQQAKLTAFDGAPVDAFGYAVAISGNGAYAVATSISDEGPGDNIQSGSAYVFKRTGASWAFQQKITAADAMAGDHFGWSVALNHAGDYLAVGAPDDDTPPWNTNGSVYIFHRTGDSWGAQSKIEPEDANTSDQFGEDIDLNAAGDYLVSGARWDDDGGTETGSAYMYTRVDTTWTLQQKLQASNPGAGDLFGHGVALNSMGNAAVIGAPGLDQAGGNAGGTYLFTRNGTNWTEQETYYGATLQPDDQHGEVIDISGDGRYLVAGVPEADEPGALSGGAYVHALDLVSGIFRKSQLESRPLGIFPNPARQNISWQLPAGFHPDQTIQLSLVNAAGQTLYQRPFSGQYDLELTGLPPGWYGLHIRQEGRTAIGSFLIAP